IALVLLAWQIVAVFRHIPAPGTPAGHLAMWGWHQDVAGWLAVAGAVALVVLGIALLRRTSLDALARRSGLVAQLRFAVTMQDLRTVILLRRQLSQENTRNRPWLKLRHGRGRFIIWRRGWHSLMRFPVSRVLRMVLLAVGAGACQLAAYNGTTALFLVSGLLLF